MGRNKGASAADLKRQRADEMRYVRLRDRTALRLGATREELASRAATNRRRQIAQDLRKEVDKKRRA